MAMLGTATPQDKTVEALAMAHRVLSSKPKKKVVISTKKPTINDQLTLI